MASPVPAHHGRPRGRVVTGAAAVVGTAAHARGFTPAPYYRHSGHSPPSLARSRTLTARITTRPRLGGEQNPPSLPLLRCAACSQGLGRRLTRPLRPRSAPPWRGLPGLMESSLPWDVGDPPDAHRASRSSGSCSGSCSRTQCAGILPGRCGGHGCEVPGTREPGDAYEGMGGDAAYEQTRLDLGLTDITKFSSYSKLWRMLYFVNDEPFRIRNYGRNVAGEW